MIHQLIFAFPRPGMSEEAFQQYWLEEHAVRYASKIPQIRRYSVDTRVPRRGETSEPLWSGLAEIWLANAEEQVASLQTPEFLEGARLDEPRWAAFWRTVVLDTETETVLPGVPDGQPQPGVKLVVLAKRREGMTVEEFRRYSRDLHAPLVTALPGIRRYDQSYTLDSWYAISEPPFDAAYHLWFDDPSAVDAAEESAQQAQVLADFDNFVNPRYRHALLFRQNWVIGPRAR
ncbi:EthD domain-containing protein [Streptomyces triticirhizae]|uniref:EthD family reductase n=1 Tax=Streptomyces triticirhizae TaxID=2483353 RepID=A0A3M2LRX2_9ACTN|nr:EthD family reductase [Streptomyces triticirhizae]RMI37618.1 EthD family reductase [Streptomyces triticirhizae]